MRRNNGRRAGLPRRAMVLALLAFAVGAPATAQDLVPDIQRIVDRGELRVAMVGRDLAPIVVTDAAGKIGGLDGALARAIAKNLGVDVNFIRTADNFDQVVDLVADGGADIGMSGLSATADRARYVQFTRPYLVQRLALALNRASAIGRFASCPTLQEFFELVATPGAVGVVEKSAYEARILDEVPTASPSLFPTSRDAFTAAVEGDVTAVLGNDLILGRLFAQMPSSRIYAALCTFEQDTDRIAIAVAPGTYGLLNYLNAFLDDRDIALTSAQVAAHEGEWAF